ncbi:MAG: hypothetical protein IK063_03010, partial [Clostridia bacterium]|nr:hypothetical protein [Clostridia bacterium]
MFKFITALIALITAINSYSVTPATDAPSKEEQHRIYEQFLTEAVNVNDWGSWGVIENTFFGVFLY